MRKISMIVNPKGKIAARAEGYAGDGCVKAMQPLMDMLKGGDKGHTEEYFQANEAEQETTIDE